MRERKIFLNEKEQLGKQEKIFMCAGIERRGKRERIFTRGTRGQ